jgi:hypothetical protein
MGSWTARQGWYEGKPLFKPSLPIPKRPVPSRRIRPVNKGILMAKEYMPGGYRQRVRMTPITR